jgi:hypothetical protein
MAQTMLKHIPADLALVIALTLACILFVLAPRLNETPVRVLLGLLLVLFLPGYSLIAALFPRRDDPDGIERIALSFGLSIAVVPLIVSSAQLHTVRDPAGACACRTVRVHGFACSGCGCAAGAGFGGGAVCGRDWGACMKIAIPKTRAEIQYHLRDPLLKNSIFIRLTSISSAGFGFIFWMLAAKLYSPQDVGIATALISSMALLVLLSRFGLDFSIIRFFPGADKSRIFSTSAIIITFFAVVFGAVFIAGVDVISPELHLLKSPRNAALFLIFLAASSVTALTAISFIAIRKAAFQFLQSIIVGSRILFLIPLIALGVIGIFGAVGISFVLALAAALVLLVRSGVRPGLVIDRGFLGEAFHFSAGNYLAGLFVTAPNMILPIMVLNVLGAEQASHY